MWKYGEDLETQGRYVLKALNSARKELTDRGKIAEELQDALTKLQEESLPSDASDQLKEFLETAPKVE